MSQVPTFPLVKIRDVILVIHFSNPGDFMRRPVEIIWQSRVWFTGHFLFLGQQLTLLGDIDLHWRLQQVKVAMGSVQFYRSKDQDEIGKTLKKICSADEINVPKWQVILFGILVSAVVGQPLQKQCHIMEAFPYFKNDLVTVKTELNDAKSRDGLKNRLVFLTELSRFLNRKAPFLLQVCIHYPSIE